MLQPVMRLGSMRQQIEKAGRMG
ncbi:MAG: hypothetical protein RL543_970, partial [Pseudomonadota bacterium]